MNRDRDDLWVSQVVLRESQAGDKQAAEERMKVLAPLRILERSPLDLDLAERLLEEEALPAKASEEALHVAIAATNNLNYLLTWNLKHINSPATKPLIEETIRESGYRPPIIGTPDQLLEVETMFAVPIVEGRRRFRKAAAASMNFDLRATFDQIKAEDWYRTVLHEGWNTEDGGCIGQLLVKRIWNSGTFPAVKCQISPMEQGVQT